MKENLNDQQFLKTIYQELLGRDIDQGGLDHYQTLIQKKQYSRKQIIRLILNSDEYRLRHAKSKIPQQVMENERLNDHEIFSGKTKLKSKPVMFNLDLIGLCNMQPRCSMCLNWKDGIGPRHHAGLTSRDIEKFGDFIKRSNTAINCSIGEPLILKDFVKILELFNKWEKLIGINSNGIALSREKTDQLAPYFNYLTITFSIDAATADTFAKIRNHQFDRIIENIKYYCKKREEISPKGYASKTGTVFMPMQANKHEVKDFIKLSADLGVDVVELRALNQIEDNHILNKGDFTFNYKDQMLSPQELEEIRLIAKEAAREYQIILDCQYQVSEEVTYDYFLPEKYRDTKIKCTLPWHFILPYQNGDTIGCCYMSQSLGNWKEEKLESLWNHSRMQKMREEMAEGIVPKECYNYKSCPIVQNEINQKSNDSPDQYLENLLNKKELAIVTPQKLPLIGGLIKKFRQRMSLEVEHLISPMFDTQRDINRHLLKEIKEIKEQLKKKEK